MFKGDPFSHMCPLLLLGDVLSVALTWVVPLLQLAIYLSSSVLHVTVYFQPLLLRSLVIGQKLSGEAAFSQPFHCGMRVVIFDLHLGRRWFLPNAALFSAAVTFWAASAVAFCSGVNQTPCTMSTNLQESRL